jgi:deazaflavin-dependent oxidoreductase (nitroreductase family)
MPAPHWLAQLNRRVTNRVLGPLARVLPGMGIVVHRGRKTQREYRTPVLVFRRGDHVIIALTYGPDTDWVRNVLAHGGGTLETRGRTIQLTQPRLFHDERRQAMPPLIRHMLGVGNVSDFLELTRVVSRES